MAVARTAARRTEQDDLGAIEAWYRHELAKPVTWPSLRYKPTRVGPTWQTETVAGQEYWVLPELTLGWGALTWAGRWLQVTRGEPWRFTLEQARFILHWYAVDDQGRWLYRDGILQRLKGWGKDPIGCTICLFELLGDCRFHDWDGSRPVGTDHPDAWVQTAAVSLKQTKNTMRLLPGLLTPEARVRYQMPIIGKEQLYALGGTRFFEAVTSSPASLEGARSTFVLLNESHHWLANNDGHDMADVIERNSTKSAGATARTLRITNAYEPGEDSIAERDREAYEASIGNRRIKAGSTRTLYDSLEAPPEAPLSAEAAPEVLLGVRGDSVWLDVEGIVDSILDSRNPPSRSRRFWYNQIVAAEDAWMSPQEWDKIKAPEKLVLPEDPIVAFFDGSKSDDATALVGCRIADGHVFLIDAWTPNRRDVNSVVPRGEVDRAVADMFESHQVKAFFADPSDVRDDEGERFWEPLLDSWHHTYGRQLELWAVRSGDRTHSIAWDMRSSERQKSFTDASMRFVTEVQAEAFTHDDNALLRRHVLNARRRPNQWGIALGKEFRDSPRKIDAAVCAVGARMVRRLWLNKEPGTKKRSGRIW